MRKFVLTNAKGESYDLNDLASFFADPSGLGFEYDVTYENYNNFFIETEREYEQPKVKGTVHFKSYEEYYNFIQFIQHRPLELCYTAYKTMYMSCNIDIVKKTEINKDTRKLESSITIVGITPFYEKVTIENGNGGVGKTYDYVYDYTYYDNDTGTVEFNSESNMESGVKITLFGPLTNPSWSHFLNGVKTCDGKVNCEIADGNKLVIDTTEKFFSILEKDSKNETVVDRYDASDFNTQRFMTIGQGNNTITATHEGTTKIKLIMEAHVNYESV